MGSGTYGIEITCCFELARLGWQRSWEEAQAGSPVTHRHQPIDLQELVGEGTPWRWERRGAWDKVRVLGTSAP